MTRIGLLSDTHAYWDEKYLEYFESCDEIWHAGDIGSVEVAEKLAAFRPLRAVYGNHRRAGNTEDVSAGKPFHGRWSRGLDQAYRRLSGQVRPFRHRQPHGSSAETFYQRTLSYIKGEIR